MYTRGAQHNQLYSMFTVQRGFLLKPGQVVHKQLPMMLVSFFTTLQGRRAVEECPHKPA